MRSQRALSRHLLHAPHWQRRSRRTRETDSAVRAALAAGCAAGGAVRSTITVEVWAGIADFTAGVVGGAPAGTSRQKRPATVSWANAASFQSRDERRLRGADSWASRPRISELEARTVSGVALMSIMGSRYSIRLTMIGIILPADRRHSRSILELIVNISN